MFIYAILSLLKQNFNPKPEKRRVSFERQSLKALSTYTTTSQRQKQNSWIEPSVQLCAEIFEGIMYYLEPKDCVKLLQLCQVWSGPASEAFYQSPPTFRFPELTSLLTASDTIHPYPLLVREFVFEGQAADDLLMGDLKACLSVCTNLASLRLDGCIHLSNLVSSFLIEHAPFLSRIELPNCSISDSFVIQLIRGVRSLRHIDVSYTNVTLATLPLLVRECAFLETLDMTGCKPTPDSMVIDYEQSEYYLVGDILKQIKNTSLTQVSLSYTQLTDSMLGYLCRHAESIEVLLLEGCINITDKGLSSVAIHCKWLRELNLGYCCLLTDIGITQLAIHLSSPSTTSPRSSMSTYHSFSEYQPPKKELTVSPLSTINLTACVYLSPSALCLLAEKCVNLKSITLDGCDKVIDWYTDVPPKTENEVDDQESFVSAQSQSQTSIAYPDWDISRKLSVSCIQVIEKKGKTT